MHQRKLRTEESEVRMEKGRTVEAVGEIGLTEAELIAANLRALGVSTEGVGRTPEDQAFDALVKEMKETGDYVTARRISEMIGVSSNTAASILNRLCRKGRVWKVPNPRTSKAAFVPKVL